METVGWVLFGLVLICLIFLWVYMKWTNREWKIKFDERIKEWAEREEKRIREDAIKRSTASRVGKEIERLVPWMEEFKYDPRDVRWIGDPIDLVIFDGYGEAKDSGELEKLHRIVFCEVKTGRAKLSKGERRIKELIEAKKVEWEERWLGVNKQ